MSEKSLTIDEAINIIQERIDSDTKVANDIYDKAYTMSVAKEASSITSWVAGAKWALDIIKSIKWNNWHTGTPTEDGEYVVLCQYRKDDGKLRKYKTVFEFKNGEWTKLPALEGNLDEFRIIAWYGQKITPAVLENTCVLEAST